MLRSGIPMRQHKQQMRMMKDGSRFALDTMNGEQLLEAGHMVLQQGGGDPKYVALVAGILEDHRQQPRNFYVTGKMRRGLMGFIRPVFEEEWRRRNKDQAIQGQGTMGLPDPQQALPMGFPTRKR